MFTHVYCLPDILYYLVIINVIPKADNYLTNKYQKALVTVIIVVVAVVMVVEFVFSLRRATMSPKFPYWDLA